MSQHPSVLPPADLASAFAAPTRAAGLQGLGKRSPARQSSTAADFHTGSPQLAEGKDTKPTDAETPTAVTAGPPEPPSSSPPGSEKTGSRSRTKMADPTRQITVYVPIQTRDDLVAERDGARARRLPTTTTDIVLDAVDACVSHLSHLLADPPPTTVGTGRSGLFTHRVARTPRQDAVQLGMRLGVGDLHVLDDLAAIHGTNRSRLVTVALQRRYNRQFDAVDD